MFGAFLVTATAFGDGHELISDSFDARGRVPLAGRLPDTGPTGTAWMVEDGAWTVRAGSAFDDTKVNEYFSGDRRAVVETRTSDMFVSAVIERKGGSEFQGVVARCAGPIDWTMAFYDGVGDLVLGAKKSEDGGAFQELGRVPVVLKNGSRHTIGLRVVDDFVSVFLDGRLVIPAPGDGIDYDGNNAATKAGIFLRGNGSSRFNEFSMSPS